MPATLLKNTALWSSASSATWQTITGMTVPVSPGIEYYFEFSLLVYAAATTTGHTVGVSGPASPTFLRYSWSIPPTLTTMQLGGSDIYDHGVATPTSSASQTATAPVETRVSGVLVPSVSGTLTCRLRPEVAAVVNVQRGSWGMVVS